MGLAGTSLRFWCCPAVILIYLFLFIDADATPPEPEEPKFNAFTGTGRRLDGKPGRHSTGSIPATTTSTTAPSATTSSSAQRPTGTPPSGSQRPSGKLVFGGGSSNGAGAGAAKVCRTCSSYVCVTEYFSNIISRRDSINKIRNCCANGVLPGVVDFLACYVSKIGWMMANRLVHSQELVTL